MDKSEKVIAPVSFRNVTKGKEYEIKRIDSKSFYLQDDNNTKLYCLFKGCGFIDGLNWQLVKKVTLSEMKRGGEYYFDDKNDIFGKFVRRSGAVYLFETTNAGPYKRNEKDGFLSFQNVKQKFTLKSN